MPTAYSQLDWPAAEFAGVNLDAAVDQLKPGQVSLAQNISTNISGQISTRPGTTMVGPTLAALSGGAPVHSTFFLSDPVSSQPTTLTLYVVGAGTGLYGWDGSAAPWFTLATGFSGNPLTGVVYRLSGTGQPWLIIADSLKMIKIAYYQGAWTTFQLGLTPDPDLPLVQVLNQLVKSINLLNSTTGLVFAGQSASGTYSATMTSLVRASGVVTATATAPENFVAGLPVFMSGTGAHPSFYGIFPVAGITSSSIFTYAQPAADETLSGGTAVGGVSATATASANLTISAVDSIDLTTIEGNPSLDTDSLWCWVWVDDITHLADAQLLFDVDPGSVSAGSLTATAFQTNYYYASFYSQLSNGWNLIQLPKSSFTRAGQGAYDWSGVVAWQFAFQAVTSDTPSVIVNSLYLQGASYPDASVGVGYDWRETRYNATTQSESNPSPVMGVQVFPLDQAVGLVPGSYSADPQVDTLRWYRRGGTLASNWYLVGSQPNTGIVTIAPNPTGVVMNAAGTQATITTLTPHKLAANDTVFLAGIPSGAAGGRQALQLTVSPTIAAQVHRQNDWVNPSNALGNSGFATATLYGSNSTVNKSSLLTLTGFNALRSLPNDAIIAGLTISLNRAQTSGTSAVYDDTILLVGTSGITLNQAAKFPAGAWPGSPTVATYQGPWGALPTLADLKSQSFGVQIGCECTLAPGNGAVVELNTVTITLDYTSALETQFDGFFPVLSVTSPTVFIVPNTIAGGSTTSGGGTAQGAFIDASSDAEIAESVILSLQNDVPITTVALDGTIIYGQPISYIWGPYGGTEIFGDGDPHQPGNLYWCDPTNPDGWGSLNFVEVTQPSDPLTNGTYWQGNPYVRSKEYFGLIQPAAVVGFYQVQDLGGGESLAVPWGLLGGSGLPFMPYVGKSGIFVSVGAQGESITDETLWPLFDPQSTRTDAVDWSHPEFIRLAFYDHHLRFVYQGKDGIKRLYKFNLNRKYWDGPSTYAFGGTLEFEQPETVETLLICGADGNLYQLNTSVSTDNGAAIVATLQTGVNIPAGWEAIEEWGHLSTDAVAPVGGIAVSAAFNSTLTSYVPIGTASSTTRSTTPMSLLDSYSRGMSLIFQWTGSGILYGWTALWRNVGVPTTHAEVPGSSYGSPHFAHAYKASVTLWSVGVVNFTLWVDNVQLPPQPIPSTGGKRLRQDIYFPLNKGQLFRTSLDSVTPNQGFHAFAEDCSLELLAFDAIQPNLVQLPFVAGGPG